jgi:uncharacterized protein (DUF4415 family)
MIISYRHGKDCCDQLFSWDSDKNGTNKKKHKVSFELASLFIHDASSLTDFDRTVNGEDRERTLRSLVPYSCLSFTAKRNTTMKKQSASSQREKPPVKKSPTMSAKLAAELKALEQMADSEIDLSDMAEVVDWSKSVVGKYYRPVKKQVSIRLDMDILAYFMGDDKAGYQVRINDALRQFVAAQSSKTPSRSGQRATNVAAKTAAQPKRKTAAKSSRSSTRRTG